MKNVVTCPLNLITYLNVRVNQTKYCLLLHIYLLHKVHTVLDFLNTKYLATLSLGLTAFGIGEFVPIKTTNDR